MKKVDWTILNDGWKCLPPGKSLMDDTFMLQDVQYSTLRSLFDPTTNFTIVAIAKLRYFFTKPFSNLFQYFQSQFSVQWIEAKIYFIEKYEIHILYGSCKHLLYRLFQMSLFCLQLSFFFFNLRTSGNLAVFGGSSSWPFRSRFLLESFQAFNKAIIGLFATCSWPFSAH